MKQQDTIENQIRDILKKSEYSFEDWTTSKQLIKSVCEDGIPNHLRLLIWKYIAQGESSNDTLNTSPNPTKLLFLHENLHKDCEQITQDYNLLSQIKSFEEVKNINTSDNNNIKVVSSPFLQNLNSNLNNNNSNSNSDSSISSPLTNSNSSVSTNTSTTSETVESTRYSNLTSDQIASKLVLFVSNFCTETKREYSIDVAKLLIPFVVLSIITQKDEVVDKNKANKDHNNPELDWMNLSIAVIDIISNSGIHPHGTAQSILLCESEMFRILLLYHDPTLSYFLDQRSVFTTSYFYEWINHMFCGCIDIKFLIQLWDIILLHQHQDFYLFFALALLISKKEYILSIKGTSKDISLVLEEKDIVNSLSNQLKLPALVKNAELYRSITPITFIRNWNKFYTYCKDPLGPKVDSIKNIYNEYKYSICMGIDVEELILTSNFGKDSKVKEKFNYYIQNDQIHDLLLFVFDCRPYRYYKCGKFPSSFHLPPGLLVSQPEEFERVSKSFIDMKGNTHFTFYDNCFQFNQVLTNSNEADTNDNGDMNMNILRFLKEGFPYVSRVPSGYKKIHDIFLSKSLELQVHLSDICPVCNPELINPPPKNNSTTTEPKTPPSKENWFNKFKNFGKRGEQNQNNNNTPNESPAKKSALELFREKLKITSKENLLSTTGEGNSLSNSNGDSNGSETNSSGGFKRSFYLPNLYPFILDCEDDSVFYEESKKYFYHLETDSESSRELDEQYKEFLKPDPIYDFDRVKSASELMESELKGEYKGLDEWLSGANVVFPCDQIIFDKDIISYKDSPQSITSIFSTTSNDSKDGKDKELSPSSLIQQRKSNSSKEPGYLVITDKLFISLKEHSKCVGYFKIEFQYELEDIRKIVTKKNNSNLLEFRFKDLLSKPSQQVSIDNLKNSSGDDSAEENSQNLIKKCYLFKESQDSESDSQLILKTIQKRTSDVN